VGKCIDAVNRPEVNIHSTDPEKVQHDQRPTTRHDQRHNTGTRELILNMSTRRTRCLDKASKEWRVLIESTPEKETKVSVVAVDTSREKKAIQGISRICTLALSLSLLFTSLLVGRLTASCRRAQQGEEDSRHRTGEFCRTWRRSSASTSTPSRRY
jgi:hypothetical protein